MYSVISEEERFVSSKSGVDPRRNHGAKCVPKKCRQTAFRLYIVDKLAYYDCVLHNLQFQHVRHILQMLQCDHNHEMLTFLPTYHVHTNYPRTGCRRSDISHHRCVPY